jgi:DNA polymerase (family 10)
MTARATRRRRPRATVENEDVARTFRHVADLLEIGGANPFRVRAYRGAARTIEDLPEPLAEMEQRGDDLDALPGIGEDLAGKIREIVRTGSLGLARELEREAPRGAVELMRVPGVGPKRARVLSEHLHVRSLGGLRRAAQQGRIRSLPGFGARTEQKLLAELARGAVTEGRLPRPRVAEYAEALLAYVRALPGVSQADLAGSYRRCRDTVGDLDVLVSGSHPSRIVEGIADYPPVETVLAQGPTKVSLRLRSGLQVDVRVLARVSYGAGLYYFTGSKAHNIKVRGRARERGLKINEYGVFRGTRRIAGETEKDVFAAVGLPWIPPELREDRGEVEAALAHRLPTLVEPRSVRGDLQCHTTDSDGRASLREMAGAAEALGYEYLAITDHTPSVRVTGGLDAAGFRGQWRRIDKLNAQLRHLTLLRGVEVDIHADGTLDLDDATLDGFDIVLVSLHSAFDLPSADQTRRIVRALRHPAVDVFAHPTGRLIGRRPGASFDLEEVCRVAAGEGKLLEVNGQPERLDLDDVGARRAIELGVRLTLGTDAHAPNELAMMRWAVDQARRGWASAHDVANTLPLGRLLKLFHSHRPRG